MPHSGRFQIRIVGPTGQRIERLDKVETVIGRSATADIMVPHPEVSRRHVTLRVEGAQVLIIDEGSKNGTFIDEQRLDPAMPRVWKEGQALRMGLAPERLTVEAVPVHNVGIEAPPPVDTQARSGTAKRGDLSREQTLSEVGVHPATSSKIQNNMVARAEVVSSNTGSGLSRGSKPSLVADLEQRMQELLARAENEARALKASAEKEIANMKAAAQREAAQFHEEAKAARLEKAKVESQLREIEAELRDRVDERKQNARAQAEAKLAVQNLETEYHRLQKARDQLSFKLAEELAELETKVAMAGAAVDQQTKELRSKAQKDSKEIIEKAKRHAELLIGEAEMKAKAQRDKLQVEMADARKQLELDLAEMKLKQTKEIKGAQDKEEARWQENRTQVAAAFLQEVRQKSEQLVYGTNLEGSIKLRLLTMIEDALYKHFLDGAEKPAPRVSEPAASPRPRPTGKMRANLTGSSSVSAATARDHEPDFEAITSGGIRIEAVEAAAAAAAAEKDDEEEPPAVPRFKFNLKIVGAAFAVIGASALGWMLKDAVMNGINDRTVASTPAKAVSRPPAPAPLPAETPPVEPVSPPPVAPPEPAPAVAASAAVPAAKTAPQQPVRAAVRPPPPDDPTDEIEEPSAYSWSEVVTSRKVRGWQSSSSKFMQRTLKVERRKISRYQLLESRLAAALSAVKGRAPASIRERTRIEEQFVKDARQLLGSAHLERLGEYRDYFMSKNQ